jgi:hypothetical protein
MFDSEFPIVIREQPQSYERFFRQELSINELNIGQIFI